MSQPGWTPASRPGIIPLHPLTFGTILGRSFAALRANPRVLLGFALSIQTVAYLIMIAAIAGISFMVFSRLDTVPEGSAEFDQLMAGSIATVVIVTFVLGIATSALSVIIQGVVVSDVAYGAVAEKRSLAVIWQRVKPVVWRLIGYSFLLGLVTLIALGLIVAAIVAITVANPFLGIALAVLVFLASIAPVLWLAVKLLLVPAAIILERATIRQAIGRSWALTRTRFWSTLGVIVLISVVFGVVGQAISVPFSLVSSAFGSVLAPTGDSEVAAVIAIVASSLLSQAVLLLIQSVALIVTSTATAIIYIDCRMRHEGLDLDLLTYVQRRDSGATNLPDPYLEHIGRNIAPRGPVGYAPPQSFQPPQGYAPPQPPQPGAAQPPLPPYAQPAPPRYGQYAPPAYGQQPPPAAAPPANSPNSDSDDPPSWATPR